MITDEAAAEYETLIRELLAPMIEAVRLVSKVGLDEKVLAWIEEHREGHTERELIELTSRMILRALPEELKYLAPGIMAGFVVRGRDMR